MNGGDEDRYLGLLLDAGSAPGTSFNPGLRHALSTPTAAASRYDADSSITGEPRWTRQSATRSRIRADP